MQKITPSLWFDDQAEEAMNFYVSILDKLLQDKDAAKSTRVMKAMMQMDKLDIKRLEQAALQ
jgi:predicted 3-demethylubiquinone-9 3-methyltransferase (glyoxalase superfamily)